MFKGYRLPIFSVFYLVLFSGFSFASPLIEGITPYKTNNYHLFTIHGSNTIGANLGPELVKSFLASQGATRINQLLGKHENEHIIRALTYKDNLPVNLEVHLEAHGSSTGFKGLKQGIADIAASSRPIKEKEQVQLIRAGDMKSLQNEHIVAIDGLAVVIHPSNPITYLSTQQIKSIFTGKIKNWKQVGWHNAKIRVLARDKKSGTFDTFKGLILRKTPLTKSAERYESNTDISTNVSRDINAIGFVSLATIGAAKPLKVSDGDSLALEPNVLSVATEDYPLSRRLYLYSKSSNKNTPVVNRFLEFIKSDTGQSVVRKVGFVSQSLFPVSTSDQSPWKRLNVNIRFNKGSSTLDNKAAIDVQRLVDYINKPENQTMQLKLVGYSNPIDSNKRASSVSRIRAQNVRWALRSSGLANKVKTEAGNLVSIADPDSINADKNRRVEVWVQ